jgi:hypothetical protein
METPEDTAALRAEIAELRAALVERENAALRTALEQKKAEEKQQSLQKQVESSLMLKSAVKLPEDPASQAPEAIPHVAASSSSAIPDSDKLEQIVAMGFTRRQASDALSLHPGDVDGAVGAILSGAASGSGAAAPGPSSTEQQLQDMGFAPDKVAHALELQEGNLEEALQNLLSAADEPEVSKRRRLNILYQSDSVAGNAASSAAMPVVEKILDVGPVVVAANTSASSQPASASDVPTSSAADSRTPSAEVRADPPSSSVFPIRFRPQSDTELDLSDDQMLPPPPKEPQSEPTNHQLQEQLSELLHKDCKIEMMIWQAGCKRQLEAQIVNEPPAMQLDKRQQLTMQMQKQMEADAPQIEQRMKMQVEELRQEPVAMQQKKLQKMRAAITMKQNMLQQMQAAAAAQENRTEEERRVAALTDALKKRLDEVEKRIAEEKSGEKAPPLEYKWTQHVFILSEESRKELGFPSAGDTLNEAQLQLLQEKNAFTAAVE